MRALRLVETVASLKTGYRRALVWIFGLAMIGTVLILSLILPKFNSEAATIMAINPNKGLTTGGTTVTITVPIAEDGDIIQTVTGYNCPTTRTRVYDARDNHSYYIQKLADGECWMLTNLAYAGDGADTYHDDKTITANTTNSYTDAYYYPNTGGATVTTEPVDPSVITGVGGQYGYLYNWCAAMGGQSAACDNVSTTGFDTSISICPSGWRLPTGGGGSELAGLNANINGGLANSDAGLLGDWLGVYGGSYGSGNYTNQGLNSRYWSSSVATVTTAYVLAFEPGNVSFTAGGGKLNGFSVRCVKDVATTPVLTVKFDGVPATVVSYSGTEIEVVAPAHAAGPVDVTISDGLAEDTLVDGYLYLDTVKISEVEPNKGLTAGGTEVTIKGDFPEVPLAQPSTLQDMTAEYCGSLPIYDKDAPDAASTIKLTDARDGTKYEVRRLQDGKCWFIDNLK
ncbi:MAG: hypothetical protein LBL08_03010, partial [Candidatus Nomurabacteria bacterium]|nr:hypothetical protein [Candidatus Nomurabacteria bacterium]